MSHLPFSLPGFDIKQVLDVENTVVIQAAATRSTALCPSCQHISQRVHSYYTRSPRDLPSSGRAVQLKLLVRRFRCQNVQCPRLTFSERLPEVVAVSAQRTVRLSATLRLFAIALSAQLASRLLKEVGMPTSSDTLVRLVKQSLVSLKEVPKALGVDDFALRRGKTYGTILVDLSTHRPIELLLERTAETLSAWLEAHPGVAYISRDRSSEYMRGASEGAPQAQQILDRWHLLKNMREVVQRIVSRAHATLKQRQKEAGVTVRTPYKKKKRSSSEVAASQVARLRRQAWYEEVVAQYQQGKSIAAIARELQMSPTTVRKFVYAGAFPEHSAHKRRQTYRLTPYLSYLQQRVADGCENASMLWQEICQQGFSHGYKVVNTWLREYLGRPGRRSSEEEKIKQQSFLNAVAAEPGLLSSRTEMREDSPSQPAEGTVEPLGSPRHLTWLLVRDPEELDQQDQLTLSFIREVGDINIAYDLTQRFFTMVRERQADRLDTWLEECQSSGVPDLQTFALWLEAGIFCLERCPQLFLQQWTS
ncbi:ISL3 family transposase [Ktedonospora formicarum]|uniref:Transposase n=1 Tax=Ktedonospora formicarum TaxID=2778364 RepID=A0A8J3I755_9CHLR|nr:ISL3 family transposase [Ktedonospora formicarum]GHO48676.1 transposase [Ktedonospora formicarum]